MMITHKEEEDHQKQITFLTYFFKKLIFFFTVLTPVHWIQNQDRGVKSRNMTLKSERNQQQNKQYKS